MSILFKTNFFKTSTLIACTAFSPVASFAQTSATESNLAPAADALFEALVEQGDADLLAFYQSQAFSPVFSKQSARFSALVAALENAAEHGLPNNDALIAELWDASNRSGQPQSDAAFEVLAASAYVNFATDLNSGLLNPDDISSLINFDTVRLSTETLMAKAAKSMGNGALYEALEPQDPSYNALQDALAGLQSLVEAGGWGPKVPAGRTLRPGNSGERVLAMRGRLQALGHVGIEGESESYDDALVEAVKAFQSDNALDADGIVGPKTLIALNSDASVQMQQVIVNLERRRWHNYNLGDRYIFVNQASFTGYVMDYGLPTLVTRVVVGKANAKYQTPEFIDQMTHMVVNPSWNVPQSIASQEYLPQLQRDPSVLARQNFAMTVRGTGQAVDARLIDMSQYSASNFPFVLRQRPGAGNALGRVKFMFPNKYNIYLHDTPAKSLFNRDTRAYSHGCVRVQRPLDLAYTLLAPQEADPEATFQAARNSGRETRINLETPVPIYLTYRSVFIDEQGELAFRIDVYGRDAEVFDALAENGVTLPEFQS